MVANRREAAHEVRIDAAGLAQARRHPEHQANGDEERYAASRYAMSFTKGLDHDATTGLLDNPAHYLAFRRAIDEGYIDPFTDSVPVPSPGTCQSRRKWEAPTAGVVYDLQGPDAQAVSMPPAPPLGSLELAFEMAEVYELALVRDEPLASFQTGGTSQTLADAVQRMNGYGYAQEGFPGRPRKTASNGQLDLQTVFRGASPGVEAGPYLSQFMLIGNEPQAGSGVNTVTDGLIQYGAQTIDQRVLEAQAGVDFMITDADWLAVQNGEDVRANGFFTGNRRFIATPRDLATYVHDDALYQAYLNACLILLSMGAPFDPAFDALSGGGQRCHTNAGGASCRSRNAGGFALYGGPHVLTLVTEVATRALKAVRYQKFNVHMRLRPEALAGRIQRAGNIAGQFPELGAKLQALEAEIQSTVSAIQSGAGGGTKYLPMAFEEGSPMHPAYGAGHATVAGACVTVLKAFFDTDSVFVQPSGGGQPTFKRRGAGDTPIAYAANANGSALNPQTPAAPLTLEGELNKLAANISIGRNMGGVHYFTDYYDSVRMGEAVALGMLEEQALCYPTDTFVMSVPTFDGALRRIGAR
jgi:hypothetical protein